jgi:hypothetical protein
MRFFEHDRGDMMNFFDALHVVLNGAASHA